ncbi:unnamed protein product, partial [Ectocarpus sp. 4 AP-2014]
ERQRAHCRLHVACRSRFAQNWENKQSKITRKPTRNNAHKRQEVRTSRLPRKLLNWAARAWEVDGRSDLRRESRLRGSNIN